MNKNNLNNKTLKFIETWPKSVELSAISDVTTQLQEATKKDIVFYGLNGHEAEIKLKHRLKVASPALLVTYGAEPHQSLYAEHIHLTPAEAKEYILLLSMSLYPIKNKKHKLVAITGTNGKTSCVGLCAQLVSAYRENVFSLGTLGLRDARGETVVEGRLTTPGVPELRKILMNLPQNSIVFIEASSHALHQNRLEGLSFTTGGWTSFGHDHLDYHKGLEQYFKAKTKIFEICNNHVFTLKSQKTLNNKLQEAGFNPQIISLLILEDIKHLGPVFNVDFNIENLSLAKAIAENILGNEINLKTFKDLALPPGRMTTIEYGTKLVVIDYAHTPDALDNVCRALRQGFGDRELWVVFGCGGDRDKTKRPLMMKVVEKYSENIIVTSDNPRTEDPLNIIEDILSGSEYEHGYEVDRASAIKLGMISAPEKAVVLIAGKGHEEYQEVGSQRLAFSDSDTVYEVIKGS